MRARPTGIAVLRYDDVGKLLAGPASPPRQLRLAGPQQGDRQIRRLGRAVHIAEPCRRRSCAAAAAGQSCLLAEAHYSVAADIRRPRQRHCRQVREQRPLQLRGGILQPYAARVTCVLLGLDQSEWRRLADITADMGLALGAVRSRWTGGGRDHRRSVQTVNCAACEVNGNDSNWRGFGPICSGFEHGAPVLVV